MSHLPDLIYDLALILIAAGFMTLIFKAIKQPVVLGYILAGFFVGPNITWLPNVIDTKGVQLWSEIGVIFLLFGLGLEFSFRRLSRIGGTATITASVEVLGMLWIGYIVGKFFSWNNTDSLFLGAIMAISSTSIILRAFEELGLKSKKFTTQVFGVLIIEDLAAIVLMVILSTVAVSSTFSGLEMGISILKLVFFLTLWFLAGIFLVPSFFKYAGKLLEQETLLIFSLGLCFIMVVLAAKAGFSPALGAFIMGSILAETAHREQIEHLLKPLKNLFAAVFFVSIGMLLNPDYIISYFYPIIIISFGVILGKAIFATTGSLLAGQNLKQSLQVGLSLTQIGEFSFIIAALGSTLGVTSKFLYPIAISVSAITTFTTPYSVKLAPHLYGFLENKLPQKWLASLNSFQAHTTRVTHTNEWKILIHKLFVKMFMNAVITVAIFLIISIYGQPKITELLSNQNNGPLISLFVSFLISAPFIWAISLGDTGHSYESLIWKNRTHRVLLFILQIIRLILTFFLLAALSARFVGFANFLIYSLIIVLIGIAVMSRYIAEIYHWFEFKFVNNLSLNKNEEIPTYPALAPWDSHLTEVKLSADSSLIGQTLLKAELREKYGIIITLIKRGSRIILAPDRNEILYPSDLLQIIGSDEQIIKFKQACEITTKHDNNDSIPEHSLYSVYVNKDHYFIDRTIKQSELRERAGALVVGIEKSGERILNPSSDTIIKDGDTLWLVLPKTNISKILET